MSENTPNIEQHAEGAARSMVELVSALQYDGIKYPQRFKESSGRARYLAGGLHENLSTAHSAVGHLAYREEPEEQKSATES